MEAVEENQETRGSPFSIRLGVCEICDDQLAKYTCPGCEVRSCSLRCVTAHKKDRSCDGIRNKTLYKPLSSFTDMDFHSDYRLLEDVSHSIDTFARDPNKQYTRCRNDLPKHLFMLRNAAHSRGMRLWFLPQNFSRHKENTTFLNWKKNIIDWRVQWLFPHAVGGQKEVISKRISETTLLKESLIELFTKTADISNDNLEPYRAAKITGVKLLLRAENMKKANNRYFELDPELSLRENLSGRTLVEFPVLVVVLMEHASNYTLVTPEEEKAEREREQQARNPSRAGITVIKSSASNDNSLPGHEEEVENKRLRLHIPCYETLCKSS